jgi:hypothetical protein
MASKRTISTEEAEKVGATLGVDWTKMPVEHFLPAGAVDEATDNF